MKSPRTTIVFAPGVSTKDPLRSVIRDTAERAARDANDESALERGGIDDRVRRSRINDRLLRRIFAAGEKALGIDSAVLDRAHDADFESAHRSSFAAQKGCQTILRARLKERHRLRNDLIRSRRLSYEGGNPVTTYCLTRPYSFSSSIRDHFGTSGSTLGYVVNWSVPQDAFHPRGIPRHNVFMRPDASPDDYAIVDSVVGVAFRAEMRTAGIVTPHVHMSANGTYAMAARGDCFSPGAAAIYVRARIEVTVVRPNGSVLELPRPAWVTLHHARVDPDCDSDRIEGIIGLDTDAEDLQMNPFQVDAGDRVVVHGMFRVRAPFRNSAVGVLDFSSTRNGLAVPSAYLVVHS